MKYIYDNKVLFPTLEGLETSTDGEMTTPQICGTFGGTLSLVRPNGDSEATCF